MDKTEAAGRSRRTAVRVLALTLVTVLLQGPGVSTPAAAAGPDAKVDPGLLALPDGKVVDFWVTFAAKAELTTAARARGWQDRGQAVVGELQRTARNSQAGVVGLLAGRRIPFESYWITNTVKVSGPKNLMRQLANRPEVERVEADRTFDLPEPTPAADPAPGAVEWNIDAVNARAVWDDLSVRGEGIVVANLDSGVQFDHPALVNQYRGNLGGSFDHNYSWFDPSKVCGNPSVVPCDNNRHGTHTMGTILGDDGTGQNGIGVAPGARWIAVKGCEATSCSTTALLAGGQWLLAPTDLNGQNPRPDLRPNVVNNSWGGPGQNVWFRDIVTAWVAAGIFPVFSNGNSGPGCGTAGSPADYAESYAVGAHASNGAIASFSSRGSLALGGLVKPNIAAPGVGVRSSVPGNSYGTLNGTSMAAPHVAGAVALMWSAAPSLVSDIARTIEILDQSAVDVADLTCGGTESDNGVWGEGTLDALAAVLSSPRGPVGTVSGVVIDQATGVPVAGARLRSVGADGIQRITTTSSTGGFSQVVAVGVLHVEVTAFGYASTSTEVVVVENETTVVDLSLSPFPRHALSGTVVDDGGAPIPRVSVSLTGVPVEPVTTDATGAFSFPALPAGAYDIAVSAGPCMTGAGREVQLDADVTEDFELTLRRDGFGYSCQSQTPAYVEAGTVVPLTGDDSVLTVALPFPFSFYGKSYSTAQVSANGLVGLSQGTYIWTNGPIPNTAVPNGTIFAFWDDLYVDGQSSVRTATLGAEPERRFVIEWRNVRWHGSQAPRFDFEVILDQRGGILLQYRGLFDDPLVRGISATIGIENETGTTGLEYSYNKATLAGTAAAVRFEAAGAVGNVAPDAVADDVSTVAGRTVTFPVLVNDDDPDGDSLDVTGVSDPAGGTAVVRDDDTITYVPDFGFSGTEVFTYDLADGRGGTDRASISVTVAPLATDDTLATAEETPRTVQVLANDLNPQGGVLSVADVSSPGHGTAVLGAGGEVAYTPAHNFYGSDAFTYSVSDGRGGFDQGHVSISVAAVNDPPLPVDDAADVPQDGVTTIAVLANDSDPDGDVVHLLSISDPPHGTATINADRTVTYRPDPGYIGMDSFTYDAGDDFGGVSWATVTMFVQPVIVTTTSTSTTSTSTTSTSTTSTSTTSTSTTLPAQSPSGLYHPLPPARILDTRNGTGGFSSPVGPNGTISVPVTGVGGVPATGVDAVVLNVTVTQPTAAGFLTISPSGTARPHASNLNFLANQTIPNLVVTKVGAGGKVDLYNYAGASHVIFDVVGWYGAENAGPGSRYNALPPSRVLDTRSGTGGFSAPVGAGGTISATVVGVGGVPATGVDAVVLNVTVTQPTAAGFLTIHPSGTARPHASNLNFLPNQTIPNLVVAKVGADGKVAVYNYAGASHVIFDIVGWYGAPGGVAGSRLNPLTPSRILDTRNGTGGFSAPVGPGGTVSATVTGVGGVPATGVDAVVLNVTVTQPTAAGFLTIHPSGTARPHASNLNFLANQTIPNLVVAKVGAGGKVDLYNYAGASHVIFDVVGWYSA
jgi:subtilisin family serine protease